MSQRLRNEVSGLIETLDRSRAASPRSIGDGGLVIDVAFEVISLYRGANAAVEERNGEVVVRYLLHPRHPMVPPVALALTRDLFNVHINDPQNCAGRLPPIPLICLGPFTPQMRVSDQVVATYDLLRWARISTEQPMNEAAAQFARRESAKPGRFPVDIRPFWRDEAERGVPTEAELPGTAGAPSTGAEAAGAACAGLRLGSGVENDVKARIERRSQGCFVRAVAQVAWRDVVEGARLDVLTRDYEYNIRPVCAGARLEVRAALPPVAEMETRRRKWLLASVERATRALGEPSPGASAGAAGPPRVHEGTGTAKGAAADEALDAIRQVAEGKGWPVSASADGVLEIAGGGPAEPAFTARAEGRGARVELPVRFLAQSGASACLRRAVLHAVLLLNARSVFARLRVVGVEPLVLRVEHQLPAEHLLEDEIEHALEGMRYAAREAVQTFDTLRHPVVSQEYVEAYEIAP